MWLKHANETFVAWIFVPFRLICDISAKEVGIVMKMVLL